MTGDVWGPLAWNAVFIAITAAVVLGGVEKGIERSAKVMMPVLAVMLLITIARSLSLPGAWEGVAFLFKPDFSKLNMGTVSAAMSQMFYSLSLGMGIMVTYGSYLSKTDNMQRSAVLIPVFDTAVALMAGLAIMPAVFAFNLQPDMGPSLIFVTLRDVFASIPLGDLFGLVFFALVFMAALTSMISMMEVVAAYFIDTFHFNRKKVALTIALAAFVVGIPSSLSFGVLKNVTLFGMNIFDFMDYLANNVLLPLTGLCTCLFIGWVWKSCLLYTSGLAMVVGR